MRTRPFRPGFDHTVEAPPSAVRDAVARLLVDGGPCEGEALKEHLMLTVPKRTRHLWSPHLHLEIVAHRSEAQKPVPERTYVRGFFTPHPNLWTAFMLTYLALATIAVFASMWGFVEWLLDEPPLALWVGFGALLPAGAMYLVSRAGRRLAADQMHVLHAVIEENLASVGALSSGAGPEPRR